MSRRCQWAGGGGTCPMALLQVTLLAWRLGPDGARGPLQPGRCCGCAGCCHGAWTGLRAAGRREGSWDLPTVAGAVGQGCGTRHAWQLCQAASELLAVSCWSEPREDGRGRERCGTGLCGVCPAPLSWCWGAPLNSAVPSRYLPAGCSSGGLRALSHSPCVCVPSRLFLPCPSLAP